MRPLAHVITSGVVSAFVWVYFRSIGCAIASFIVGVFIDLDHLIDYYSSHNFTMNAKDIYDACRKVNLKKIYSPLHSYELLILIWSSIYVLSLPNLWKALAIGLTQHMIFDQIANPITAFGYFLTYRALKGFKKELLIQEMRRKE